MSDNSFLQKNFFSVTSNIIKHNRLSHAYLIEVDNYDNDFTNVMMFVKMILCNKTYEEILKCDDKIIHLIDSFQYPDISIISSDNSVINKSSIINLQKEFLNKSLYDNKRIYIIKESEKLNLAAANTILKFLEEPEDDIVAILLTDNRYHVLDTILSRCQILSLKDDSLNYVFDDSLLDLLDCILSPNQYFLQYNSLKDTLLKDKSDFLSKLVEIESLLLLYLSDEDRNNIDSGFLVLLKSISYQKIISILSVIENEIPKLNFNVNFKLWMDSFFSNLIGV